MDADLLQSFYIRSQQRAMALRAALIGRMQLIIMQLEQQGSLDFRFRDTIQLKEIQGPNFFANLLPTFLNDTRTALRDLTKLMEAEFLNFEAVDQVAIKLRGATASIGLCRMARSCGDLRNAAGNRIPAGCALAVNELKHEFSRIYQKLEEVGQLERRLVAVGDGS
ncbi:hypothetical protein Dimus_011580 [Dionaea muscipula]